ncbi:MAG: UDP-N-acetylmuramate dehydrogenase [Gemmatimonadetes bacterium]|nr:UDP-N-acetylmuramate dehydrogenase [Gemmatimonadota bacterium]
MTMLMTMERKEWQRRLGEIVHGRIAFDEPLAAYTTLRVGGPADAIVFPESIEEIRGVVRMTRAQSLPLLVLGGGSDVVVRDGGFRGVVLRMGRNFAGSRVIAGDRIEARAGESFPSLLRTARTGSLAGLEFLATVPGCVGGGVATNVGAYGQWFADVLVSYTLLDRDARETNVPRDQMEFGYRYARLPEGSVITGAVFQLTMKPRDEIEETVRNYAQSRRDSQPLRASSAGCIFKNPDNAKQAGYLIDKAGLKGMAVGGAAISEQHGNFLINRGGATANDVLTLLAEVRKIVKKRYDVELEPEVRILGEDE